MRMQSLPWTLGAALARSAASAFAANPITIASDDASDCARNKRRPLFISHQTVFDPGRIKK